MHARAAGCLLAVAAAVVLAGCGGGGGKDRFTIEYVGDNQTIADMARVIDEGGYTKAALGALEDTLTAPEQARRRAPLEQGPPVTHSGDTIAINGGFFFDLPPLLRRANPSLSQEELIRQIDQVVAWTMLHEFGHLAIENLGIAVQRVEETIDGFLVVILRKTDRGGDIARGGERFFQLWERATSQEPEARSYFRAHALDLARARAITCPIAAADDDARARCPIADVVAATETAFGDFLKG